ncbi:MAG: NfeD family protein [Pseudomonadota bacterium]
MNFSQLHWYLIVGAVLLLIEIIGFTGFLIGIAVAALVTAAVTWLSAPMSVLSSALLFGVLSVALTFVYWRYFRAFNSATDAPGLHQRAAAQRGKALTLDTAVGAAPVAQFIGDTRWQVVSASEDVLAAGTAVTVTAVRDDGTLVIEAAQYSAQV